MMAGVDVEIAGLVRTHVKGRHTIEVLRGIDLHLAPGDRVAVVGPSGCGKSTFLHLLGLLDHPTAGTVTIDGQATAGLPEPRLAEMRNRRIGFVFQAHHLLPEQSAVGNVSVPVRLSGASPAVAIARAEALLAAVGLAARLTHKPGELSGGEQQRVAIARALVMSPGLVLADEPTGNLDPATADGVFELLLELNAQLGSTLVVVTHSRELAQRFPRRLSLEEGRFRAW
jgi:lipoprotein-releasing system ATP-binding protein